MKKLILTAAILGTISVPGIVMAQHGADDTAAHIQREDRPSTSTALKNTVSETNNMPSNDDRRQNSIQTNNGMVRLETKTQAPANSIRPFAALTTAQAVFPDKSITKIEVETEEGRTVYSVRFSDGSRVDVDALTGVVVRKQNSVAVTTSTAKTTTSTVSSSHGHGSDDVTPELHHSGHGSDD
jgi:uncharacterized membrane protein YkoI